MHIYREKIFAPSQLGLDAQPFRKGLPRWRANRRGCDLWVCQVGEGLLGMLHPRAAGEKPDELTTVAGVEIFAQGQIGELEHVRAVVFATQAVVSLARQTQAFVHAFEATRIGVLRARMGRTKSTPLFSLMILTISRSSE